MKRIKKEIPMEIQYIGLIKAAVTKYNLRQRAEM